MGLGRGLIQIKVFNTFYLKFFLILLLIIFILYIFIEILALLKWIFIFLA